jgi:hypothetical protein
MDEKQQHTRRLTANAFATLSCHVATGLLACGLAVAHGKRAVHKDELGATVCLEALIGGVVDSLVLVGPR